MEALNIKTSTSQHGGSNVGQVDRGSEIPQRWK